MPLPGDLTTITVTATYRDGVGNPLSGSVTFTPAADLVDSTGHVILRAEPIACAVVGGIMSPPALICTDNSTISPSGWTWNVTEYISGVGANAATRSYSILLPHTLGSTVDLSTLSPTVPQAGVTSYLLATNNLSDLSNAATARTNLGLGGAAIENVGTGAGTVAAGNDARITGALQSANNLSDVASTATARTNLGLAAGATAAAATTVQPGTSYGTASAVGAATTYAREDHQHGTPALTSSAPATAEGIGQAAAVGTATAPARADHVHPMAAAGTPVASAVGDAAATGSATTFAASDHKHGRESFGSAPATTLGIGTAAAAGSATTPSRSDHVHPTAAAGAPGASAVGDSASTGVATTPAASDHRHAREAFGAVTALTAFNTASGTGSAATVSHSDHVHGAPALPAASTSAAGIVQLDGTATDIQPVGAQAPGATGLAADAGHVHPSTGVTWFNVQAPAYGARGNGNLVADAAMTATSATLTSATAGFTSADVGKLIQVRGAGAAGADLNTTISAFTNSTTVTLTAAAATTVSAAQCVYGTDDAAAVQAAITAAQATLYGTVYLPPGIYMWSTAVSISKCMRITGQNALIVTTNSGALNLTNTFLSPTPGVFGRTAGLEIDHLQIDATGGHAIYNVNLSNFTWHDLVLTQRSSNFAAVYHDQTGTNLISGDIYNVKTYVYGSARTMQAWHLVSHVGGGLALTQWTNCLWQNQGTDTAQFLLWTEARGGTNYTNGLALDSCVFTSATGGGAAFWSAQGVVLKNVRVVNSNNTTNGNSIYRVGTNTGSGVSTYTSQGVTIIGCGRDLPGPNGTSTWDVHLDASVDTVAIIAFECRWRAQDSAQTPFFNFNGATHVVVLDCPTAVITNPGNAIQIPVSGDGNNAATGDGAVSFGSLALTTALPIGSGGTGAATQQAALNAIAGSVASGQYPRGNGSNVAMSAIQAADLPAASTSTQGAVVIDGTAGDIAALGAQAAGSIGKAADAGHVHPTTGVVTTLNGSSGAVTAAYPLAVVAKVTGNTTAAANTVVPCDTTSGVLTVTLPSAPADRTMVGIKHVIQGGTNAVTIACGGTDVFNKTGGPTSGSLGLANQAMLLIYAAASGIWYVLSDDLPLSDLDGRYVLQSSLPLAIASGGTGQATQQAAINALTGTQSAGKVLRSDGTNATLAAIQAGDLPAATTSVQGAVILDGTAADIAALGTQAAGSIGKAADAGHVHPLSATSNVQTFTANGTWNKPSTATMVTVICIGAGGGGGSGGVENSGTVASGGAGGGGGGYTIKTIPAALLSSSETVTVSATGGTGGPAAGTTAGPGTAGNAGGATTFKSSSWAVANGGAGGGAGGTGAATGGTGGVGSINGGTGGATSATGAAGSTGAGSNQGGSGGGGGGGLATTPASVAGGAGGLIQSNSGLAGGTAGTSGGGAGGAGNSAGANAPIAGTGGGGGGSLAGGTGGSGGLGGNYGGGGGGGAGATTGQTSGAGGTGAGGLCVVISIN